MDEEAPPWREIHKASEALHQLAEASNATTDRYRGIPSVDSIASNELSRFADRSVLGEAYDKGVRSLVVACDYTSALNRILSEPMLTFSPWTCLRHILELCSMCIWMLDSRIGPEKRATRSLNVQFQENDNERKFLRKSLSGNSEDTLIANANARETRLREQAQQLGIKEKRDKKSRFLGFGGGPTLITDRIDSTLKDTVPYSLLSPAAHGDTWAILALGTETISTRPARVVSDLSPVYALALITESFTCITKSLRTYYELYGYDIAEYSEMLEPLQQCVRQAGLLILDPHINPINEDA